MEDSSLSECVHVSDSINVDEDDFQEVDKKKKCIGSSSKRRRKNSISERLDVALSLWIEAMNARTEAYKAKAELEKAKLERYKAQTNHAASPMPDPYSIKACMELLNSMEDIPSKIYIAASVKFMDRDWRRMFIKMPLFRRKDWLTSLE